MSEKVPNSSGEKDLKAHLKRFKTWNILLIRNDGMARSMWNLKGLMIAASVALGIAITPIILFGIQYSGLGAESRSLQTALDTARREVTRLRKEKKALMVQLVVAESKALKRQSETHKQQPQEVLDDLPLGEDSPALVAKAEPDDTKLQMNKNVSTAPSASDQPAPASKVDIEDFTIRYQVADSTVKIAFNIKKSDPRVETVSGYTFVILKPHGTGADQWVPIPAVSLVAGKPANIKRGSSFSISRFKPMVFKIIIAGEFKRFKTATVLILNDNGQTLLEKDISINLG